MKIYGIIHQSSDDISCHSVYTDMNKRDKVLDYLRKNYENDDNLYYDFVKSIWTIIPSKYLSIINGESKS